MFSDPDCDFDLCYLNQIRSKSISEYTSYDWMNVFQWPCPLGTFEEVSALVPFALSILERRREGNIDVFYSFLHWMTGNEDKLASSSLIEEVYPRVANILKSCLVDYVVVSRDDNVYVKDCNFVFEALSSAIENFRMRGVIDMLNLTELTVPCFAKAAWIIEIECFMRSGMLKCYNPLGDEDIRIKTIDHAYGIVLQRILTSEDVVMNRYLINKLESNYIGV